MIKVIKKHGKMVMAYRLGEKDFVMDKLISEGKVIPLGNGTFEVMSQEAVNGKSGHGQIGKTGDYIKIDSSGFPYPNDAKWFQENHRWITGNEYEQIPTPLDAWTANEPMCKEVEFLIQNKGLVIDEENPEEYFSAVLWGTKEAAARDSVVVFYSISYDDEGKVTDAEFNFVVRDEFQKTYDYC